MNLRSSLPILCLLASLTSCMQNTAPAKMKEISRDNANIDYHIAGKGDTTLLFIHGANIDQTYWNDQVAYFSKHYQVVTMDLPGHGKSGKERTNWTIRGFAEDVNTLIRELGLKNVIIVGHSLGCDVSLIAATSNPAPIVGFVSVDYFKDAATPLPAEYQPMKDSIMASMKSDFANTNEKYVRMQLATDKTSQEVVTRVVKDFRSAYQPMALLIMPEVFDEMYKTETELLPKLKWKLHLINVDYMPTNEEALKQHAVNGYEIHHMPGTSHYPMLENPALFNEKLQEAISHISNNG